MHRVHRKLTHPLDLLVPHVSAARVWVAAQLFGLPANQMNRSLTNITVDSTALFLFNFQVCSILFFTACHDTCAVNAGNGVHALLFLRHPTGPDV